MTQVDNGGLRGMLEAFQSRMQPIFKRERCEVCGDPLARNNDNQVVRFCGRVCRRFRHHVKKLLEG